MKQCKCEHWQQCPVCMPHRFDTKGNLLPPEPTPLQACRAQVTALTSALFQVQEAAKALADIPQRTPLTDDEIDKIITEHVRITDPNLQGAIYMAMRDLEAAHGIVEIDDSAKAQKDRSVQRAPKKART